MAVLLLAGTRKGLFLLRSEDRRTWELGEPLLTGWEVFHATLDPRDGTSYACTNSFVYGAAVHRSSDLGQTWERAEELGLPEDSGLTLEKTWHVEPGRDGEVWLGGAPGVLFRSGDGGTWEPVGGILGHPTRERWMPGAGGMCTHSIQLDPNEPNRIYIGISAAGGFRSDDGGETWTPINKNVAAEFMPDPYPEVGQCVHKLLLHPEQPERLWQQNHCGVYRSDTAATNGSGWTGTGCRAASASRSRSIRGSRTPRSSSLRGRREPGHDQRPHRRLEHERRRSDLGGAHERAARPRVRRDHARGVSIRPPLARRDLLRDAERLDLRLPERRRGVGRGGEPAAARALGGGGGIAVILLPSIMAAEAGGRNRFETNAPTVAEALRGLPIANLLFDERGELRRLVNVYVDGVDVRDRGGLDARLDGETIRIVGAVAGGEI